MDDKGQIISSCDVDENLALQMWTKGTTPRLVILNKNQNKKKFTRLGWLEDQDRKLSIKGKQRGSIINYPLTDLLPYMQRILSEYAVYTSFKTYLWQFTVTFERVLHAPAIVFDKKELALLPEEKRTRLWISDLTGEERGAGYFRPFFSLDENEKATLGECLPFTENRCNVDDLVKTGAIRKLNGANLTRWNRPLRVVTAAMLLGFSFCGEDGSEFTDSLWDAGNFEKPLSFKISDPRLRGLGRKFVGYLRHFAMLGDITVWASLESEKDLLDDDYTRRRRIDFPAGLLGPGESSVTFFEREDDGMMALACKPKMRSSRGSGSGLYYASPPQKSQEKQELVYTFPKTLYERAVSNDSFGGAADDYFTVGQIASAKMFEAWCGSLLPYIAYFTG